MMFSSHKPVVKTPEPRANSTRAFKFRAMIPAQWGLPLTSAQGPIASFRARSHLDRFTPDSVAKLFWAPERATLIQEQRLRRNIDSKIFAPIRLLRVSRLLPSFATESP